VTDLAIQPEVRATDRPLAAGFDGRVNLIGLDRQEMADALLDAGERPDKV